MNDDQLMARTAQGDDEGFRLLVERWQQPVFAFLHRMAGSREDALELSQETFLRVHRGARRYRATGQFRSWLFRIAGNLARSYLRRKRIVRWLPFNPQKHDVAAQGESPDAALEREEAGRAVRKALAHLSDRQRQAVVLRRYHELSYQEIAAAMDTTVAAVESLLQRAMSALRNELAGKVVGTDESPKQSGGSL